MKRKQMSALLLVVCLLAGLLSACGSSKDMNDFAKDALDARYLGVYSDLYLKKAGLKESEARADRQTALQEEAQAFAKAFDIDWELCGEKQQNRAVKLMDKLLAKAQYEVSSVSRSGDSYLVTLSVTPLDLVSRLRDEVWESVQLDWLADYSNLADMEPEELEVEWAKRILSAAEDLLDTAGYLPQEDITVQVEKVKGDYGIHELDLQRIGALVVKY